MIRITSRAATAALALAASTAAHTHTGADGGAHHGVFQEIAHGVAHLDPLLALALLCAAAVGIVAGVARLLRRR
ncbi:hypothetical protein [Zeimonas arvi]|uniref:Uncharacterized protein n=1 Tax=Zeimonas arvi TaxID=2498847 RepID=A0A5C8NWH2_9BURK|nr:hypothetical protein [Zeimonas arvi]TXL65541.1 hypothetical protein FHP08_12250 [Zeimonas arvi]